MDINIQLSKVGISNLIKILGDKTYQLFKLRGLKDYSAQSLSKLIINLHGENEVLRNKLIRDNLINTLKNKDINEIISLLNIKDFEDPWEEIKKLKFKENSKELKILELKFNVKKRQIFSENLIEENPEIIKPERGLFDHQIEMLEEVSSGY